MFYPVRVYTPKGNLKETISSKTLTKKHWDELDIDTESIKELRVQCNNDKKATAIRNRKAIPKVCAIWPIICAYSPCSAPAIKRSSGGRYCSKDCLRQAANERRRSK